MFIGIHIYNKLNFGHNFLKKRYPTNIISNMNYEIDTLKPKSDVSYTNAIYIEKALLYVTFDRYDLNSNNRLHTSLENN